MAGKTRSRRGFVRIIGQSAWLRTATPQTGGTADAKPWATDSILFPPVVARRALVSYRAILGGQGEERLRDDRKSGGFIFRPGTWVTASGRARTRC